MPHKNSPAEPQPPKQDQGAENSGKGDHIPCNCKQTSSSSSAHENSKPEDLDSALPRFGPCFGVDSEAIKAAKKEAWEHVLTNRKGTERVFLEAIKGIEKEAKATYEYDPEIVGKLRKKEFVLMMIKDGCFFLQLALSILGGSELLGYPEDHVYLGKSDEEMTSQWIKSMYFVGNQIPCIVLRKLMEQSFFQDVIKSGIEENIWPGDYLHGSDFPKMVLYLMVVEPEVKKNQKPDPSDLFSKLKFKKQEAINLRDDTSDLLHACHCLILGTGNQPLDDETAYALDLEAGDKDHSFPSANELRKSGIKIKKANNGIKEIQFKRLFWYWGRLYLPPLTFDDETENILHYLKCYEEQHLDKEEREVTAYLRFIKDLVQSSDDFKILEEKKIIQVTKKDPKHNLHRMLNRLVPSKKIPLSLNLHVLRLQIKRYSELPRAFLDLAVFFTLVQTFFTLLGYFEPRN